MGEVVEVLDLFSAAAGGWSLGMHRAGFTTMAACEAVDWRRTLYSQNNPGVKVYDDVCTLTAKRLLSDFGRLPSVVVGSPPCQDISSANTKGKGVKGERSGLFFEAVRLIGEVRPRWFALENSANLRTRGADAVLAALEAIGYTCWTFVVRAADIGANHERPRSWIIGCDLEQVGNANFKPCSARIDSTSREGADEFRSGRFQPVPKSGGDGAFLSGDASEVGCGSRFPRGHPGAAGRPEQSACGNAPFDAPDAAQDGHAARAGNGEGSRGEENGGEPTNVSAPGSDPDHGSIGPGHVCKHGVRWPHACEPCDDAAWAARATPNPDQTGQADGCMEPCVRSPQVADDGCGDGRRDDGSSRRQVAICEDDRRCAAVGGPLWSLDDLASRLRLDDGLPARVAGTRIAVGGPRGTVAASLIVEAYGDAVVPQIPEAIGRAMLRVERALHSIYAQEAAA